MILKLVPRDHVDQLPVPKRIKDYLKTPNYYSENITEEEEEEVELDIKSPEAEERPLEDTTQNYAAAMWSFFFLFTKKNAEYKIEIPFSNNILSYYKSSLFWASLKVPQIVIVTYLCLCLLDKLQFTRQA